MNPDTRQYQRHYQHQYQHHQYQHHHEQEQHKPKGNPLVTRLFRVLIDYLEDALIASVKLVLHILKVPLMILLMIYALRYFYHNATTSLDLRFVPDPICNALQLQ